MCLLSSWESQPDKLIELFARCYLYTDLGPTASIKNTLPSKIILKLDISYIIRTYARKNT